jgi:hypothetical protein
MTLDQWRKRSQDEKVPSMSVAEEEEWQKPVLLAP